MNLFKFAIMSFICDIRGHDISIEEENRLFEQANNEIETECIRCGFLLIATKDPHTETYTTREMPYE